MPTYETLDLIADSYNPLLFIGYLIFSVIYWRRGDRLAPLRGFAGIAIAYLVMFMESLAGLWPAFGLDYSTHSSVALALIVFHVHKRTLLSPPAVALILSLLCYYLLEVYQEYHTVLDIVSTVLVVGPLVIVIYRVLGGTGEGIIRGGRVEGR